MESTVICRGIAGRRARIEEEMETEEEGDEEEEAVEGNGDPEVGLFYRNDTLKK